jgi:hypothetical protein
MPVLRTKGWRIDWLRNPRDPRCWTYALTDGEAVKIGTSTNHPLCRLGDLQTGSSRRLTMVGYTAHVGERQLHRRLHRDRLHHEWFAVSDRLLTELAAFDYLDASAYAALRARLLAVAPPAGRDVPCSATARSSGTAPTTATAAKPPPPGSPAVPPTARPLTSSNPPLTPTYRPAVACVPTPTAASTACACRASAGRS